MRRPGVASALLSALTRPGVAVAVPALLFAIFAARATTPPIDDPDVWWIAAAGRDVLRTGTSPTLNTYSFTAPDHPWVMHEILFGVVYALGLRAIGPSFVPLLSLGLAALTIVAASRATRRSLHPASAVLTLVLLLVGAREALFAPRPSHASLVFPMIMALVALRPGWTLLRTATVVLLEIVWANAHGSFPLGTAILAAAILEEGESSSSRRARAASTALAATATLLNPYGLHLHELVRSYLEGADGAAAVVHRHIVEFFPVWRSSAPFVNPFNAVALVLVGLFGASAILHRRSLGRSALAAALVALGCYQARHVTLAVVLGFVLVHPEIDRLCAEAAPGEDSKTAPLRWWFVAPGLVLAAALWWSAAGRRAPENWISAGIGGADLWRLAENLPADAHVYAPFQESGLVIWLGAPRGVRVFFDSRNDCYPPEVAEAAFALEGPAGSELARQTLDRYQTNFALVSDEHPVFTGLSMSRDWSVRERSGHWFTLARNLGR